MVNPLLTELVKSRQLDMDLWTLTLDIVVHKHTISNHLDLVLGQ